MLTVCTQGTTNSLRHFRTYHPEQYRQALAAHDAHLAKSGATQLKIGPPPLSEKTRNKLTTALAEMVCMDAEPFSIVERKVR